MEKDNGAMSFTEGAIYENPTKENSYLDLSYLNKIERENALDLVLSKDKTMERDIFEDYEYLHLHKKDGWRVDRRIDTLGKERITYSQFLEMMGSEGKAEGEKKLNLIGKTDDGKVFIDYKELAQLRKTNLSNAILIEKLEKENKELVEVLESVKEAFDNGDILVSHRIFETLNKVKPKAI